MKPVVTIADLDRMDFQPRGEAHERFGASIADITGPAAEGYGLGAMHVRVKPGKRAFPYHNHLANPEMFIILEGAGTYRFGGEDHPVAAGDVCFAPKGGPETAAPEVHRAARGHQGLLGRRAIGRAREKDEKMLEIKNLHADLEGEDKTILKGVDLTVETGKVHAIMGPNGSGKSTLSYILSGRDGYEVTQGSATLDGQNLLEMEPEERAAAGLFLAFQYPVEIPGVGNMTFLRTALNAQRKLRGQEEMSAGDFLKVIRAKAKDLKIDAEMLKRPVNVGFSGGEKKRNEILQMAMLEPKMCILDETDSGLDVDAMKLVAQGVNALRDGKRSFLVITHYQRLLDHIQPDVVHIMAAGRIIKTGGPELALEVETNGYNDLLTEVA